MIAEVPTLVEQNKNDPWAETDMVNEYFEAPTVQREMKWFDIEKSRFAPMTLWPAPGDLVNWFDNHIEAPCSLLVKRSLRSWLSRPRRHRCALRRHQRPFT